MTAPAADASSAHMIVLPGGGYAEHAPHEAEPIADWLGQIGVPASVFRYPLHTRHPAPLEALRAEISRRRANGARRIGLIGFSAGGHLAAWLPWPPAPRRNRPCSSQCWATPSPRWKPRPTAPLG